MKKTELAWCAGFFDGEGTIYQLGVTPYVYLWQSTKEPLDRFKGIVGYGIVYNKNNKGAYCYYVGGGNGMKVIKALLPYLVVKRDKAIRAIVDRRLMKRPNYKQRQ